MNLLAAKNYDPTGGAVSKVTTSLIAMTALDTTNLRNAVTVPAHGMLHIRMSCIHHGATTTAQGFLGCLDGATLRGRCAPTQNLLGTAIATSQIKWEVAYTLTGLTPGAMNLDAAYGVEIISSAGGALKYGGPNNTTTNDGFGGFNFEVWDPQPLKLALDGGVNVTQFGGTAGTFSGGRPEVNTSHAAGTAWGSGAITAASIAATALNGKGDWNIGKTGYALSAAGVQAIWDTLTSALTAVGSIGKLLVDNINATITSRMASYTQPTGFLAATFPATVASTTNITAGTITTATNVTTVNGLAAGVITAASIAADAITDAKVASDVTIASVTGAVGSVTGAVGSVTGSVGSVVGLTVANLDTTVSSRLAPTVAGRTLDVTATGAAGIDWGNLENPTTAVNLSATNIDVDQVVASVSGAVGSVTGSVGSVTGAVGSVTGNVGGSVASVVGAVGSVTGLTAANLDVAVSTRLATASYTAPDNTSIAAILIDTAEIGVAGAGLTNINLPNQTMDIVGSITGNLSGSVGSVTGAVGSVTGNVGGSVGSVVGLTASNLDATVSSRASAVDLATVAGYLDTEIAAILADTNELQTDWTNGGRLDLILDARASQVSVDDLPTNAELAAALATADDAVLAQVALVKAKTDSLSFSVAGQVDSNLQYVNDVQVGGTGASGSEWGPL